MKCVPASKMKRRFFILAVLLVQTLPLRSQAPAASIPSSASPIRFEDIAKSAGITFVTNNSPTSNRNEPETMGGGVALLDYDGDGYLDIYAVNGAAIPSLKKEIGRAHV